MKKSFCKALSILLSCILFECAGCASPPHYHEWTDGKCDGCGEICSHEWSSDTQCEICGIKLSVTTLELPCKSENGNIFGLMYLPSVYHGKLKTIIACHGFGVNASNAMPTYLAQRGYACYTFDFAAAAAQREAT